MIWVVSYEVVVVLLPSGDLCLYVNEYQMSIDLVFVNYIDLQTSASLWVSTTLVSYRYALRFWAYSYSAEISMKYHIKQKYNVCGFHQSTKHYCYTWNGCVGSLWVPEFCPTAIIVGKSLISCDTECSRIQVRVSATVCFKQPYWRA